MVEVCGGILSFFEPNTLWRPPDIGSAFDVAKLSNISLAGLTPDTMAERRA